MHFRILKMITASGFLTALECTKLVSAWDPPRNTLGELTVFPKPTSCFKGTFFLRRRGDKRGKRKEEMGVVEGRGEERKRGCPLTQIPGSAPENCCSYYNPQHSVL